MNEQLASNDAMHAVASKLDHLIALLSRPNVPADKELWDANAVAAYLGVCSRTVAESYALRRDFPTPILLSPGSTKSQKRWKAVEVMKWAERQR